MDIMIRRTGDIYTVTIIVKKVSPTTETTFHFMHDEHDPPWHGHRAKVRLFRRKPYTSPSRRATSVVATSDWFST